MVDSKALVLRTIGHGNRSGEEFLQVLAAAGIECLIDVRAYPASRRHPQFALLETGSRRMPD